MRRILFRILARTLVALTGDGYNRSARFNALHHKLSYRLHKLKPAFGVTGIQQVSLEALGMKLRVNAADGGVAHRFLVYGEYEPFETSLVQRIVSAGMTVYNIGANIGYYTVLCSKAVEQNGKVYAFEPSPENFALLKENIALNGCTNVEPMNVAVARETGSLSLFKSTTNSGDHQVYSSGETRESVTVRAMSVDDLIASGFRQPDVIVMDVQGAELEVLLGAKRTLGSRQVVILTEFWPEGLKRASGSDAAERMLDIMKSGGRTLYEINEKSRGVTQIAPADLISSIPFNEERNLLATSAPSPSL